VLNIAEEFFINKNKEERETNKKECVIDLMLPFFINDKQLLLQHLATRLDKRRREVDCM
jgi:hypothetical protein